MYEPIQLSLGKVMMLMIALPLFWHACIKACVSDGGGGVGRWKAFRGPGEDFQQGDGGVHDSHSGLRESERLVARSDVSVVRRWRGADRAFEC